MTFDIFRHRMIKKAEVQENMDKNVRENTRVIVDDTTIYEIDLSCYHCLPESEKQKYFKTEERRKIERE